MRLRECSRDGDRDAARACARADEARPRTDPLAQAGGGREVTVIERKPRTSEWAAELTIRRLQDRDEIRRLLEARRPYAAYALGQLDPILFRLTEWWTALGNGDSALVLHSRGGLGSA